MMELWLIIGSAVLLVFIGFAFVREARRRSDPLSMRVRYPEWEAHLKERTPIMLEASRGAVPKMKRILAGDPGAIMQATSHHWTSLHWAAEAGKTEAVAALLNAGADVNSLDDEGMSPLFRACENGDAETTKCLLDHSARIDILTRYGVTPLIAAADGGNVEVVEQILAKTPASSIDHRDEEGHTALMVCAISGEEEVFELLLKRGANPKLKDNEGKTAYDHAVDTWPEIADRLKLAE